MKKKITEERFDLIKKLLAEPKANKQKICRLMDISTPTIYMVHKAVGIADYVRLQKEHSAKYNKPKGAPVEELQEVIEAVEEPTVDASVLSELGRIAEALEEIVAELKK